MPAKVSIVKRSVSLIAGIAVYLSQLAPALAATDGERLQLSTPAAGSLGVSTGRSGETSAAAASARDDGMPELDSEADPLLRHEAELAQLQAHLAQLRTRLENDIGYRDALLTELKQFEQDIDALSRASHQLAAMVAEQRELVAATAARLEATRSDLGRARAALAELVRAAYAMGRGDEIRLLLGQDDPRRAERVLGYYQVIGARRAASVEQIYQLERALQRLEQQQREETTRLARLAARQDQARDRLAGAHRARQTILEDLERAIASDQSRAAALAADAEAMRALIERLKRNAEIADEVELSQALISDRRGQLAWPIAGAELVRGFGEGRKQGALHADGVLLAAAPGAEVRAVHHGRVAYAGWLRGFGMLLVIDHGEGYMSLYGHNQSLLKEVGEWVATGDPIALAGSSGGADLNGLYFAIRHQGRALDPGRWCQPARG